jgi:hypothetical protein
MNPTATRPRPRPAASRAVDPPPFAGRAAAAADAARAGLLAAAAGLLVVAVPVVLVWWGEDRSGTDIVDAARSAVQLWLVGHGAWLQGPSGSLGLAPLGLTALPVWLSWRAGRSVASRTGLGSARAALLVGAGAGAAYATVAVALAAASHGGGLGIVLWTALAGPALLVGAVASAGALHASRHGSGVPGRLSPRRAAVLRAGTAATLLLLAAGGLLAGTSLALDTAAAARVAETSEPGAVGGLGLALLGAVLLPNAAVWGASWLAGPGFAVGAGTAVGPFGVVLGPLPALPLLAALPTSPPPTWLGALALAVPVAAGALAGWGFLRAAGTCSWVRLLLDAGSAGVLAGGLTGVLAALSGGPLGGERLAAVGPSAGPVAAAVAVEVALGAVCAVVLRRLRERAAGDVDAPTVTEPA